MLGDSTHYTGKVDYSQPRLGFEGLPELERYDIVCILRILIPFINHHLSMRQYTNVVCFSVLHSNLLCLKQ